VAERIENESLDMAKKPTSPKSIENIQHTDASRKHIPTAEFQPLLSQEQKSPILAAYERRNPDLDPQLVWRGKDLQDWSDLVVQVPPLYIQEKIHPKVLVDDLRRQSEAQRRNGREPQQLDMFADFNGLPSEEAKTEFYQHEANWSNRMILGDSLQVMASLAEREGLRGKVQCIYIDPPYGIKFNSNFQWSTTSRDVKDGKVDHITREPEQVKAFRDTWRDGIHSYLTYIRDRLTLAHELLSNNGSILVQISDENLHRVRSLLDEIFGDNNNIAIIRFKRGGFQTAAFLPETHDFILWYAKEKSLLKFRRTYTTSERKDAFPGQSLFAEYSDCTVKRINRSEIMSNIPRVFRHRAAYSATGSEGSRFPVIYQGKPFKPSSQRGWSTNELGMDRLAKSNRLFVVGNTLERKMYFEDSPFQYLSTDWQDTVSSGFGDEKLYVVQTQSLVVQRCILMTTDPGDLVLDPTCGSGTTAYVAEQWGRRWVTIDTSRVALALARMRIMGARYPYYLLKDSREGQVKEAELIRTIPSSEPTYGNIRQGFVYERVPHIMLKSIANNAEIDVIWEQYQQVMGPFQEQLNAALGTSWQEWEIPRHAEDGWPAPARELHGKWWELRIARQKEIDASIAAKAEYEYLYDKPYEDPKKVRVAGPFTVESLSPHRILGVDEDDELIDQVSDGKAGYAPGQSFEQVILENLRRAGVQQAHKEDKISFFSLTPWPGYYICAEGRYFEGGEERGRERRAGIFIGPEFGTVSRPDLVAAAREAGDAGFDVLVACAFNYDARSTELSRLGAIPILKARMNADLHMAGDLKNTGKGNLFVIFGEPDIDLLETTDGQIQVRINGVDVFHPGTGEVRSDGPDGIACWFIDTDYNEESFFVRHAYFLGANDPYSALKTTLKAEINEEAWASLHSDVSRPFEKPESGRIAVKVINHLGDEVMKVFRVK
jgi:adenine-specific DNA-methyltransferase